MTTVNTTAKIVTPEEAVLQLLQRGAGGKLFSCSFIKRSKTEEEPILREGTFRLSSTMTKGKTGKGMAYSPTDKGLITVYDMTSKAYRMINIEGIATISIGGSKFIVDRHVPLLRALGKI